MTDPDNIPTFNMPPPQSASSNSDINNVRPQLPIPNELFEPSSSLDPSHSFKSQRISSDNNHSNALMAPPSRMDHPPPNTRTDNIFFKTRHCVNFELGTCRKGEYCSYAHGKEELRQPVPNWQDLKRLQLCGNRDDCSLLQKDTAKFRNDSWKTRESSAITISTVGNNLEGTEERNTAKFRNDSWKKRESSAITISTVGNNLEGTEERLQLGGNRNHYSFLHEDSAKFSGETRESSAITIKTVTKPPRGTYWKTNICTKWKDTGNCSLGDYCNFAHGDEDLHVPGGGIKFKTKAAVAIANSTKAGIPTLPTTGSSAKHAPTLPASLAIANSSQAVIPTTLPTTGPSANHPKAPTLPASVPAVTEEEKKKAKKELFLNKNLNKINRIYGDWIDDLPRDHPDLPREP